VTLAPIQMPSPETFNTNIVAKFLRFLTDTHMPQSDQRFRSDDPQKLAMAARNSN
jgi:hypothetical protein